MVVHPVTSYSNDAFTISAQLTLTTSQYAVLGQPFILTCAVSADFTSAGIGWLRNDNGAERALGQMTLGCRKFGPQPGYNYTCDISDSQNRTYSITINNVTASETGVVWNCYDASSSSTTSNTYRVTVVCKFLNHLIRYFIDQWNMVLQECSSCNTDKAL